MRHLLLLFGLTALAGCRCGEGTQGRWGELAVSSEDGAEVGAGGTLEIDFGGVTLASETTLRVTLHNRGTAPLQLREFEVMEGSISFGAPAGDAPFSAPLNVGDVLDVGESREVVVAFRPRANDLTQDASFSSRFRVHVDGAREDEGWLDVALRGVGLGDQCELPPVLDFGFVWTGEKFELPLLLENTAREARTASVEAIGGVDAQAFTFAEGAPGDVQLGADAYQRYVLRFSPAEVRPYQATMRVRRSDRCEWRDLALVGNGIDRAVVWRPAVLDCGHVPVGLKRDVALTFTNVGHADATVSLLPLANGPFQLLDAPASFDLGKEGGSLSVSVRCTPPSRALFQDTLSFETSLPRQPEGEVPLRLVGGGPDVEVTPSSLDFGEVAYVAGASPPVVQRRTLTVSNVGDPVLDPSGHLRLGKPGSGGAYGPPYVAVRSVNADTTASEFTAQVAASYSDEDGLEPPGGRNTVAVTVTLSPASSGLKQAELVIYSNDLDEPEVAIPLSAEAMVLPECQYEVSTSSLPFGMVSHPGELTLSFSVRNVGEQPQDDCILSAVGLVSGSDLAFSLVEPPISRKLAPGESQTIGVRYRPPPNSASNPLASLGEVEFFLSSKERPRATVKLHGLSGAQCLTLIPTEVDFGGVKVGCGSPVRKVKASNGCLFPIHLDDYAVLDAASVPGGGAAFRFASGLDVSDGGVELPAGSGPYEFEVAFEPLELGVASGFASFDVTQKSAAVSYALPLRGRGETSGLREDAYRQNPEPKLDLVISYMALQPMCEEWQWVPQNVEALFDDLVAKGIDFHIGVNYDKADVSLPWDDEAPLGTGGRFISDGDPNAPLARFGPDAGSPAVLTPTTPNVKQVFLDKFWQEGCGPGNGYLGAGQCFESIYKATTPPVSENENAGFLREEAGLAALCFSAFREVSPAGGTNIEPVSKSYSKLLSIKGPERKRDFGFAAAASLTPQSIIDCKNNQNSPLITRYSDMAELMGGAASDICQANWYPPLAESLGAAAGYRTEFPLSGQADTSQTPVEVRVDGAATSPTNSSGDEVWTFDSARSRVVFSKGHVPPPGSEVRIRYLQACL